MNEFEFIVNEQEIGTRLDLFLSNKISNKSRSFFQKNIEKELVKVNGLAKKVNYKLKLNDKVYIKIEEDEKLELKPEDIPIDILYEDDDVIVVNKSQGMVVHPGAGNFNKTLVNALLYHCDKLSSINGDLRPGIVHRIDKDTSGVLVIAKNNKSHENLAKQLEEHSTKRIYIALVEGIIKSEEMNTIDKPIARHPADRVKMAIVEGGRRAVTHYKVLERFKNNTLIFCRLETGRTHQIRVHMASIGHPLVGDPIYGYKKQRFKLKGQMLHAKKLGFIHPSTHEYMEFESELPSYFERIINILKKELQNQK